MALGIKRAEIIPAAAESSPSPGHKGPVLDCSRDCVLNAAEAVEGIDREGEDVDDDEG
jgi:hypothetical protein